MDEQWRTIRKIKEHRIDKNKNLAAILVTKENAEELSKEMKFFALFNENVICTGFMALRSLPTWLICLNPKSKKVKRYTFETEFLFDKYFELEEHV